ncbi:hypothetical protein GCM10023189_42990 [Nibrella saemangeumensis]|uniref:DUF4258 domain-containing protein n=1 Tax=Nibrella saemangeumensis TaxID=1084526 RepID=A0ABP8NDK0_9BACT
MTDLQERINNFLRYSDQTLKTQTAVISQRLNRACTQYEAARLDYQIITCAGILRQYGLQMGQDIIFRGLTYRLTDVSTGGEPVGVVVRKDGSTGTKILVFFSWRLQQAKPINSEV